jgi:hypothetical protein
VFDYMPQQINTKPQCAHRKVRLRDGITLLK